VPASNNVVVQWAGYFRRGILTFKHKQDTVADNYLRFSRTASNSVKSYRQEDWTMESIGIHEGYQVLRWEYDNGLDFTDAADAGLDLDDDGWIERL
jgi:hypothetical protein